MKILLSSILLLSSIQSFGHARLRSDGVVPPRNNSAGLKSGPCGGVARTNNPTTLTAGETITITWEETIQHPGEYRFSISEANDENFNLRLVVPDTQDNRNDLPHQYSAEFTVPNITCEECTFQMIQVMTENPANPSLYFSCADIRIIAGENPPEEEMPEPVPAPTPVPIPVNNNPAPDNDGDNKKSDCH